jgi:hypothetical protein
MFLSRDFALRTTAQFSTNHSIKIRKKVSNYFLLAGAIWKIFAMNRLLLFYFPFDLYIKKNYNVSGKFRLTEEQTEQVVDRARYQPFSK